jgi:hypothetical protein
MSRPGSVASKTSILYFFQIFVVYFTKFDSSVCYSGRVSIYIPRREQQLMKHRLATIWCGPITAVLLFSSTSAFAAGYRILPEQSVFAVVTHKGGFAGGLAHDHFIAASKYTARLELTDTHPLATQFQISFLAGDLVVDGNKLRQRWYPRLEALGILDTPFGDLSDEDREKIRKTMLGDKQLDANAFPEISARIASIEEETKVQGDIQLTHRVTLALSVHGQTVEKPVWVRRELGDGVLRVEAFGEFRFSDFGIKPYSAMLGAVKNKNEFHIYVFLVAVPDSE